MSGNNFGAALAALSGSTDSAPSIQPATVTSVSPTMVTIDGANTAVIAQNACRYDYPAVNDRVLVTKIQDRLFVMAVLVQQNSNRQHYIGEMYDWMGSASNVPVGSHVADGSAVSRSTYAAAFAALGTIHGSGDGTTTFNLPNAGGKFVDGATSGNSGATGGNQGHNHSLSGTNAQALLSGSSTVVGIGTLYTVASGSWNEAFRVTGTSGSTGSRTAGIGVVGVTDTNADTRPPYITAIKCVQLY